MSGPPLITMEKVSLRVRDRVVLPDTSWAIGQNENWAILGPNGVGKSTLVKSLFGNVPAVKGKITCRFSKDLPPYPSANSRFIGYVSPELLQEIINNEKIIDESRYFSGQIDRVTTVSRIIAGGDVRGDVPAAKKKYRIRETAARLDVDGLLARDIRSLSVGELRRVLIARALMKRPRLLILDEPFDGLDQLSRMRLIATIDDFMNQGTQVVLITQRHEEIPDGISHILYLKDGRIHSYGRKETLLRAAFIGQVFGVHPESFPKAQSVKSTQGSTFRPLQRAPGPVDVTARGYPLIVMKNVTVKYGERLILNAVNWTMDTDENWLILGPEGAGKTTLMKLISGDHLQAFSSHVEVFGKRKSAGERDRDLKRHIGMVSSDLQLRFSKNMAAFDVVCSGFRDALGLYRTCDAEELAAAHHWIESLGIAHLTDRNFQDLSHGQRQMVLIARAMVKSPDLLILDEPCEGLDIAHRMKLLELIDGIGRHTRTALIYAAYDKNEFIPCTTHVLELERGCVKTIRRI